LGVLLAQIAIALVSQRGYHAFFPPLCESLTVTQHDAIAAPLARALKTRGYVDLTPVQEAVIEPALLGRDALVSAQTGSGKTVAFGLALAPTILDGQDRFGPAATPLALAIAPTRELAMQVKRELEWLYAETGVRIASCVGGMDMRSERRALDRGAHIVVGTPGRLRDHLQRASLDMGAIRAVVLDEADEMLDLGFREDLEFILEAAPKTRRTLMFSATVPRAIAALAKRYQKDAARITAGAEREQHVDIEYRALSCAPADRENAIINVLRYYDARNALVFCATRATVNHMTARFNNRGFSVVALSGELSQNERSHALQAMRDGRARVCIATDVAARGIDLPGLELVVHADLPQNREALLHRSGRTGRAGHKGVSALIVPANMRKKAERLLSSARVAAKWDSPPSAADVLKRDNERMLVALETPVKLDEDARAAAAELIERVPPEQLAAAYIALYRGRQSAPEELSPVRSDGPAARIPRDEFKRSVWARITVGRNQRAEPRWLLPMLCRAGKISKGDIGAIRLQADESFVQLNAEAADAFFAAIGPDGKLEQGITAIRLAHAPDLERDPTVRPRAPKRPFHEGKAKRFEKAQHKSKRQDSPSEGGPEVSRAKPRAGKDRPGDHLPDTGRGKKNDLQHPSSVKAAAGRRDEARKPAAAKGKGKPSKSGAARKAPKSDWAPKFEGAGDAAPRRKSKPGAADLSASLGERGAKKPRHKKSGLGKFAKKKKTPRKP